MEQVKTLNRHDVVIVGGGLSGSLAAWRLKQTCPDLVVLLLESGSALGGNHTWSFHETDLSRAQSDWLAPFIVKRWPQQRVRFPALDRLIATGYCTITSERLNEIGRSRLGASVQTQSNVVFVGANEVRLADGRTITARCILDCRGAIADQAIVVGYQKFVGREVVTLQPHGIEEPVIMDASVPQIDGYRFVYVLPLDPRTLLIEDTYYSDLPNMDGQAVTTRIDDYARARGWDVTEILRDEHGVLPIALGGDIDAFWRNRRAQSPCAVGGLRAALFHPTTGYSLPDAVALADMLATFAPLETAAVAAFIEHHSRRLWKERAFFRMLNRMLFLAAVPDQRWRILQRFYRLPDGLISRFYAAHLTPFDKARILFGAPPVPVGKAVWAMSENSLNRWAENSVASTKTDR